MSIMWGVLRQKDASVAESEMQSLGQSTCRYETNPAKIHTSGRIGMGIQMMSTHRRSTMEDGVVCDDFGNVLCLDGRLDNVEYIASLLNMDPTRTSDSQIILSALRQWGADCLSRFTGDWALAFWSETQERLILARDHAGSRSLYLYLGHLGVLWATHLDTFMGSGMDLSLCHNYAAAYLSFQPVRDHTPYTRVRKVPPGQHIIIENGRVAMRRHWSPLAMTSISYRSDGEYDQHFLTLFSQAVARRSGEGAQILAHLSGGMDSTSIVCMSDHLRRSADHPIGLLDTMSFYDDSEASLSERNYFTITEAQRGKTGIHVNTAMSLRTFEPAPTHGGAYYIPGADSFSLEQENRLLETVWNRGYRVILSGIGGDEVLGGIPSGLPELADALVSGDLRRFVKRSIAWCLVERRPLINSMFETGYYTFRLYAKGAADNREAPPWLSRRLKELIRHEERRRPSVGERLRAVPHELDNAETWDYIMETLPHMRPQLLFRPEYRYPMLDKDLVEFLFSIPREQLVRPGRRRSLMRRALRGIVPEAILERRRKAFQLRASLNAFRRSEAQLSRLWDRPLLGDLGFIAVDSLKREFKRCVSGDAEWNQALMRTIAYELWLRSHHSDAYCHERASPVSS